jgi:hypothetical protein
VVLGDLAELATAARPPENSIAVSVVSMPGVSAQTDGDGEQPAASAYAAPSLPGRTRPSRTQRRPLVPCGRQARQIRKTCGVAAYLRVVIENDRTQASRTMNAETAQTVTKRVN